MSIDIMKSNAMPTIICDTREKKPLDFGAGVDVVKRKLDSGDYSIDGYENKIAIERKSLQDLVNTVTAGHERFRAEYLRMMKLDFACVVVEARLSKLLAHGYHGKSDPLTILRICLTLILKYRIPILFVENREQAAFVVKEILYKYVKMNGGKQT